MLIWKNGFEITDISRKQAMKEGFAEALGSVMNAEALRKEIITALDSKGCAFKVKRKGKLVGCYVLMRETVEADQLMEKHAELKDVLSEKQGAEDVCPVQLDHVSEGAPKTETAQLVEVLRLTMRVVLPEHDESLNVLEHSSDMTTEIKNLLLDGHTKAVFWGGRTAMPRKLHAGGKSASGMVVGMCVGVMFGFALNSMALGICFGVAFAALFGTAMSGSGEK